jgi:thiol-disulfide isomerase/thioredoxin
VVQDEVRQQISEGLVVVMMHRFDCEVCEEMAPRYSAYYQQFVDQGADEFKIAFLAIPPYGDEDHVPDDTLCIVGRLSDE